MADLTPPVALAAFAAASIAKASPMKIGIKAVQIAVAGFVIPYMTVYDPMLMLQGSPTLLGVLYIVGKAVLATAVWASTPSVSSGSRYACGNVFSASSPVPCWLPALPATDEG